jgi:hypothetical protein
MTLIDRLSKLEGPDREVDAEIAIHLLGYTRVNRMEKWPEAQPIWDFYEGDPLNSNGALIQPFTASVDAAIALAERVLPGYSRIMWEHPGECHVDMFKLGELQKLPDGRLHKERYNLVQVEQAPTLAIALCIAILRAKEASA